MGTLNLAGTANTTFTVPSTHTIYDGPLVHSTDGLGVLVAAGIFAQLVENTVLSGIATISLLIDWGTPNFTSEMGLCVIDSSRTGFSVILQNTTLKIRNEVAGSGGSNIATTTYAFSGLFQLDVVINTATGEIDVKIDDVSQLTGTYTGSLTGLRGGIQQYLYNGVASVNRELTITVGSAPGGGLKYWDGSTWVAKPLKYWSGSAWVEKPLRRWDGAGWVPSATGPPPSGAIVFDFDAGDTYSTIKDGFSWDSGRTIAAPAGESEAGGVFSWGPNVYPEQDSTDENGFYFNQMSEFWFKMRFFIPPNYFHRFTLRLTVTGDLSAWQVGDTILATDGVKTGELYYIDGSEVHLLFADDAGSDVIWSGTITNSTRGQSRSSTRVSFHSANNKLLALWCNGYSGSGTSPTVVWELLPDGFGGSTLYYHYTVDGGGTGQSGPASTSPEANFISISDAGKWLDFIVHIKMATTSSGTNGIIEGWKRVEGASTYTKLWTQTDAFIGERAGGGQFRRGYVHGWANSGYKELTQIYDSLIVLSPTTIDSVS